MANPPEFKRSVSIEPAAGPVGAQDAVKGFKASSEAMAALGASIASDAASQRAQLEGLKEGQVPGKKFIPPITRTDKEFQQSYVNESTKVLGSQFQQLSNKLKAEFLQDPNPTGNDLVRYQQNLTEGAQSLLSLADKRTAGDLGRSFVSSIDSDMLTLSRMVNNADRARLKDNFNVSSQNNMESIYNLNKNGLESDALETLERQINNIEHSLSEGTINNSQAQQMGKAARLAFEGSLHEAKIDKAFSEENGSVKAAKTLQDFANNPQERLSESDKQSLMPQLYSYYGNKVKFASLNDMELTTQAATEIEQSPTGMLPPDRIDFFKENLSDGSFKKLELQLIKSEMKQMEKLDLLNYGIENRENGSLLNTLAPSNKDIIFDEALKSETQKKGSTLSLEEEGNIAAAFDTTFPRMGKRLTGQIESTNNEASVAGATLFRKMQEKNRLSVASVEPKAQIRANLINSKMSAQGDAKNAVDFANKKLAGKTQQDITNLSTMFSEELRTRQISSQSGQRRYIASQMGWDASTLPPGITSDYFEAFKSAYVLSDGEWGSANEFAAAQIALNYTETKSNGFTQVMKDAPDKFFSTDFLNKQKEISLQGILSSTNNHFANGTLPYKYEILSTPQKPTIEQAARKNLVRSSASADIFDLLQDPLQSILLELTPTSQEIRATRTNQFGRKVEGLLILSEDPITQSPKPGQTPTWGWMFKADDEVFPSAVQTVSDDIIQNARFGVSPEDLAREQPSDSDREIERAWGFAKGQAMAKARSLGFFKGNFKKLLIKAGLGDEAIKEILENTKSDEGE